MKKTLKLLTLVLVLVMALTTFTGCEQVKGTLEQVKGTVENFINGLVGGNDPAETVIVTWYDGTKQLKSQEIVKGGTVQSYNPAEKAGYTFQAWYADSNFTTLFDFSAPINEDTSIYAAYVDAGFVADETAYYLIGDGRGDLSVSNWDHGASMGEDSLCFKNANIPGANVFTTTITMYAGDRFQICHDGVWDGQVGIGVMEGAQLNEAGDYAFVVDDHGITIFEAPKNEYHADYRAWDVTLAEGQDGVYKFTYTTYADPSKNVLTWELVEKLDASDAPVAAVELYFTGTFNDWTTAFEAGSEWMLYDNEDGTWEGIMIITPDMYGDWTITEVGTLCAALKLYDKANDAWIGYNGEGNLLLKEGVYRIVYTVATGTFVCEIVDGGEIVEGSGSGSGGNGGQITWFLKGTMNNWSDNAEYVLVYDENGNASITVELKEGDNFKVADSSWANEFGFSAVQGNPNFTEGTDNGNIQVAVAGTYTITVTAMGGLSITADGEPSEPVVPVQIEWYLKGTMNGWSDNAEYLFTYDENGVATLTVALNAGDNFKIANSNWTSEFGYSAVQGNANFAEGTNDEGVKNGNIAVAVAGTYTFTITNGTLTITSDGEGTDPSDPVDPPVDPDPSEPVTPPATEGITLYYYNTKNWSNVNVYTFANHTTVGANWPGTAMTAVEGKAGWYTVTLNVSAEGLYVIFNNGSGDQSADLAYTGLNYWVGNSNKAYETLEEAEEAASGPSVPETGWYVRGTMNGWGTGDALVFDENGNPSITIELAAGDIFKVATSDWKSEHKYSADLGADFKEGAENGNIEVVVGGTYTITIVNGKLVITK